LTNNPLANRGIDYWYKAMLVIAIVILITSLKIEMKGENRVEV
jgi:hypothetical protein